MFNDEGTRSSKQIQGSAKDGSVKNFIIENGRLLVSLGSGVDDEAVKVQSVQDVETTIAAGKEKITDKTITVNKKVTSISIANYSEENDINVIVGEKIFVIGKNVATDLPINTDVTTIQITATTETEVQYIIKGVE